MSIGNGGKNIKGDLGKLDLLPHMGAQNLIGEHTIIAAVFLKRTAYALLWCVTLECS